MNATVDVSLAFEVDLARVLPSTEMMMAGRTSPECPRHSGHVAEPAVPSSGANPVDGAR